ncbi:MAG: DUF3800 domain-containing protein, partial [Cyanobacteria bacterium P01_E01_bin.6]
MNTRLEEHLSIRQHVGRRPAYRLYIDEVGNSDLNASTNSNHRYLSLSGLVIKTSQILSIQGIVEELKNKYFPSGDGQQIILHRKELMRATYPFHSLKDIQTRNSFNSDLLEILSRLEYRLITVVIDKLEHKQKYSVWTAHPYHYCMEVMLERYVRWLSQIHSCGDVLAESRGKQDDKKLRNSFKRIFSRGTRYGNPIDFQKRLTSSELKLANKQKNHAGLQIVDLLAHPSYRNMKFEREGTPSKDDFGTKIVSILKNG